MGTFRYLPMAASIFNFFMPVSMVVDSKCDYYQDLTLGQQYYIYNKEYPSSYSSSTSCRWVAHSDPGTKIVISCEDIAIPSSTDCSSDRLSISLSGNESFTDSRNYCGTGSVSLVTNGNALAVGLFAGANTRGGRFVCTITAIQDSSGSTTESSLPGCDCGWKQGTRIVGGVETGINEFPSMAGLVDKDRKQIYCGGSIISTKYVLTAAHCVSDKQASVIAVLVGDHNPNTGMETAAASLHPVASFHINPDYNPTTFANDLAIVETSTTIRYTIYVGPVCLPFRYTTFDFDKANVTALGWGTIEFSGPTSDTLQKVNLTVISNDQCARQVEEPVTSKQVCTYYPGRDACQYDSGGPLLWTDTSTKRLQLIGVISFGVGCATQRPGVNTRVTSYLSWILSETSDTSYCIR